MNIKALLFSIIGFVVGAFYALESFLYFQGNGLAAPLLIKLAICGIGFYYFWRNLKRIKSSNQTDSETNAT